LTNGITVLPGYRLDKSERRKAVIEAVVVILAVVLSCYVLYRWSPAEYSFYPPCPWHWLTGTDCPGCGSLRGISAMLHGQFWGLWRSNPLAMLFAPLILYGGIIVMIKAIIGYRPPVVMFPAWTYRSIPVVIVLYWIGRNIASI